MINFGIFSPYYRVLFRLFGPNNKRDFYLFFMDGRVSGGVARGDENAIFR